MTQIPSPDFKPRPRLRMIAGHLRRWLIIEEWRQEKETLVTVGDYTYRGKGFEIRAWDNLSRCRIGKFCSIAEEVQVFLGGNHRHDWVTSYPIAENPSPSNFAGTRLGVSPRSNGDVTIGNDVWIGIGASIMSGVTVADGAVIAARAHVVKDVKPYEMVGGNPARHISFRFDQDSISRLLALKWWDWDIETIVANEQLLMTPPTPEILDRLEAVSRSGAE